MSYRIPFLNRPSATSLIFNGSYLLLPRFALGWVEIDLVARAERRVCLRNDLGEFRKESDGNGNTGGWAKINLDLRAIRIDEFKENRKSPRALYDGLTNTDRLVGKLGIIILKPYLKPRLKFRKSVGKRPRLADREIQVANFGMLLVELVVLTVVDAIGDFAGKHDELIYTRLNG